MKKFLYFNSLIFTVAAILFTVQIANAAPTVLQVQGGGTGWGNVVTGTILYGNGANRLATTTAGSNGNVLFLFNGVPTWASSPTTTANTWALLQTMPAASTTNLTASKFWIIGQSAGCAQFDSSAQLTSTGINCGTGSGGADSFTHTSTYGITSPSATSSGMIFSAPSGSIFSLMASSTAQFVNASTTNLTIFTGGNLWHKQLTGPAELAITSTGLEYAAATTTAGTGLSYTAGSFNVNTSQNIATLSNLTTDGFVKTSGAAGTLGVQTFPCTFAQGCTGATTFSANQVIYSNGAGNALVGAATSSPGFYASGGVNGNVLGITNGVVGWVATSSTNSYGWPWTITAYGESTSTIMNYTSGLMSISASSTIGNGISSLYMYGAATSSLFATGTSTPFVVLNPNSATNTAVSIGFNTFSSTTVSTPTTTAAVTGVLTQGTFAGGPGSAKGNLVFSTLRSGTLTEAVRILDTGFFGIATSAPGTVFSVGGVVNMTTATDTFYGGGISIQQGCFAIIATCLSLSNLSGQVPLATGISGTLPLANGGTNASLSGASQVPFMNAGNTALTTSANITFDGSKLTLLSASTTNESISNFFQIPNSATQAPTQAGSFGFDTTDGQLKIGSGSATQVYTQFRYIVMPYSTTTAWTGTTTLPEFVLPDGMTFDSATCYGTPSSATVNAQIQYGPSPTKLTMFSASSSLTNVMAFTSTNTPAAHATSTIAYGTPSGSPTAMTCTVKARVTGT